VPPFLDFGIKTPLRYLIAYDMSFLGDATKVWQTMGFLLSLVGCLSVAKASSSAICAAYDTRQIEHNEA